MKKNKVLLNILSVICFIYGALYVFSLVFIPVGIYCFSAGKKFSYKAEHLLDNFSVDKKIMKGYSIFVSIACFPFGLLSIIAYLGVYGNNVKIETTEFIKANSEDVKSEQTENIKTDDIAVDSQDKNDNSQSEETESEKLEKLEKLRNFRDKNIITEEEYEMARDQILGKK